MVGVTDELVLGFVLTGGFSLLGSIVLIQSLFAILRGHLSKYWPQTKATVIESKLEEQLHAEGLWLFFPRIRYRYVVQGREYESTVITFPTWASASRRRIETTLNKYPVSGTVLASYLPNKPTVSVLEPGLNTSVFIGVSIGFVFLLSGFFGCYFLLLHTPR